MRQLDVGPLPPFETRGWIERRYLINTLSRPFSGYLGGWHHGGYWNEYLSEQWRETFKVRHAIPCNSATSGLLAACMAIGIGPRDIVWAPVYTMSATAACAKLLGADVRFTDIDFDYFTMSLPTTQQKPKAIIVTNLFGHPAELKMMRAWCDEHKIWMIEDNAQAPFAKEFNVYTGTIGHIGVYSLNIHKHLQTGEGGVVVTNSDNLALGVRDAINHGELRYGGKTGLNLRMTEPIAALAAAQLTRGPKIIEGRRELALELTDMVEPYPLIRPPQERAGCQHVYYIWAARLRGLERGLFTSRMNGFGFPITDGYSPLLNRVFKTGGNFPIAQAMEDKELITFDVCSYSPSRKQRKIMREVFKVVGDSFK